MSNDDALIVCKRSSSLLPAAMLAAYERHQGAIGTDAEADKLILQYGRPFTGIKRPKGYRDRAQKKCFLNAVNLTTAKRGTYCEGFAAGVGSSFIFHHAWITLDGEHAIDVTLSDAEDHFYFGIAFPSPQFNEVLRQRIQNTELRPFISDPIDDLLRRVVHDMTLQGTLPVATTVSEQNDPKTS
jgi:hypothetical protein